MVQEPRGGKRIGDIQGKIAIAGSKGCEHLELVGIAYQVAIGGRTHQGLQGPALIRTCDASSSKPDAFRPAATADCHGLAQLGRLIKVSDY